MKILILISIFIGSGLYALSLDKLIIKALQKNPSIKSISYRLAANKSHIDASGQFSNPLLTYSKNSIDEKQPMSKSTVSISQKLPFYGKRDSLKNTALIEKDILKERLFQAKVSLVQSIKNQAYSVWELENLYKIITGYEELTQQNIELFESYTSTSDKHMGIMSAELTLSDLKIQKSHLNTKIATAYSKLSYLCAFEVNDLDLELSITDMPSVENLRIDLVNNPKLAIREKEIQKSEAILNTAKLDNYPDANLLASYSYRKNFDNYFTFGIGISLPIYSTEDYKEEKARQLTLSSKSLKNDTKIFVNSAFTSAYIDMKSAYDIYHIVHDEAIPKINHMFKLTSSSTSTGGDLFKYIDILVKKLKLEQQSIQAMANYHRSYAKISALSGDLK